MNDAKLGADKKFLTEIEVHEMTVFHTGSETSRPGVPDLVVRCR